MFDEYIRRNDSRKTKTHLYYRQEREKVISLLVLGSSGPNSFRGARGRWVVVVRARYFLRGRVSFLLLICLFKAVTC